MMEDCPINPNLVPFGQPGSRSARIEPVIDDHVRDGFYRFAAAFSREANTDLRVLRRHV